MSCGVDHRLGSDPVLLWLWHRPAATAPIGVLAWELPYAASVALKNKKPKKKKKLKKGLLLQKTTAKKVPSKIPQAYNV